MIQAHDDYRPDSRTESLAAGAGERRAKWVRRKPVAACLTALGVVGSLVLVQQLLKSARTELHLHATLKGRTKINGVVFSPDGKTLATIRREEDGSQAQTVELWEAATGRKRAVLKWKTVLRGGGLDGTVHFSPDSATLATAGYGSDAITLKLWDVKTGQERATLKGPSRIRSVVFSPDGKTVALEGWADTITLRDAATGRKRVTLKTTEVLRVANGLHPVVILSPDGKTILTAGKDGTIQLWEAATGRERATLQRPVLDLIKAAFSPDGKNLTTMAGKDRTVQLWDVATGRERATLIKLKAPPNGGRGEHELVFSPDGKTLATHENYDLRLWDVATANQRRIFRRVAYFHFSPESKRLTTGAAFTSKLWDVATGKQLAVFPGVNRPVVFSPDGKILATANEEVKDGKTPDGIVKLWDAATGQMLDTLKLKDQAKEHISLDFTPDGKTLVARGWSLFVGAGAIRLWDVATRKERAALTGLSNVREHKISPDGKTLALRAGDAVQLWDITTAKQRAILEKTDTLLPIGVMLFSPDGKTLATGGADDKIKLWDVASGRLRAQLERAGRNFDMVVFNPDSKTVATAVGGNPNGIGLGSMKLWDVATGRELALLPGAQSAVFSTETKMLVTIGTEAAVKLWDVETAKERAALENPIEGIQYMLFSPDGKSLATMMWSDERRGQPSIDTVQLWDAATGKERATLKGAGRAAFSPDGKLLVTTKRNGIKLWDAATGRERAAFWNKWPLAFSPDSKTLVTVSDDKVGDGKVRLWDTATGTERIALEGVGVAFLDPDDKVAGMQAVFSPDGKLLATQSRETVKLWDVETGKKLTTHNGDGKVVFSSDGKILATEPRSGIELCDVATGKARATLRGQWFMAFSPDSSLLATSDDKDIHLWHLSPKK